MAETSIGIAAASRPRRQAARRRAVRQLRAAPARPALAILLVWEIVVRAFAPAYVAKPSTVLLAIPRVIVDPAFLQRARRDARRGRRRPRHRDRRSAPSSAC